jgi:RHS repeat-associated protein
VGLIAGSALRDIVAAIDPADDVPYDAAPAGVGTERRLLKSRQQLYYRDDLSGPLLLGQVESRALPFESYDLALTAGLVTELTTPSPPLAIGVGEAQPLPNLLLGTGVGEGHYVQRPGDTGYWTRSGQIRFAPSRFYLPVEAVDPFDQHHFVIYDDFSLLVTATKDPLDSVTRALNDYRVLAPSQVTDANLNRIAVRFDALGMVTAISVTGKESAPEGDTPALPGVTMEYQLLRWQNPGPDGPLPAVVHTTALEVHGQAAPAQHSYTYSDGSGRIVMEKVQAEPGPLIDPNGTVIVAQADPRWVGTGRTVFNNKGKPVKQYEPFFSATFEFEDETAVVQTGVTPILHYDALDRVVRTDLPNGTLSRAVFDIWSQESWDPSDTVLESTWYTTRGSPDPSLPAPSDAQGRAAWLAARHAGTPTVTYLDALGRPFLVVTHNRTYSTTAGVPPTDDLFETRTSLDVEGNALAVIDPRQAIRTPLNPAATLIRRFDVLSRVQRSESKDAGTRLTVVDAGGKPLRLWDSRGQIFRHRYDGLQRASHLFVQQTVIDRPGQDLTERLLVRTVYGEAIDGRPVTPPAPPPSLPAPPGPPPTPSAAQALNLRGKIYRVYDCAGAVSNDSFDFKNNLTSSTRRLAADHRVEPKWNTPGRDITPLEDPVAIQNIAKTFLEAPVLPPALSFTVFAVTMQYDALNRVISRTTPDLSVTVPSYNAAGLLERVRVSVRGGPLGTAIHDIDYNARGQRLFYAYADPTAGGTTDTVSCQTEYRYDPLTFRLAELVTTRVNDPSGDMTLQDLAYTLDPVGNIVQLNDAGVFQTNVPTSKSLYVYDALYRLIQATGREHPGQAGGQRGPDDANPSPIPNTADLQALVDYNELYAYDPAGNIEQVMHIAAQGTTQWTRRYQYALDDNRLTATSRAGDANGVFSDTGYEYTLNGALKVMPHLAVIHWDYADRMQHTSRGTGDDVFFTYDSGSQRIRKVWEHGNNVDERIYVGGWESFRHHAGTQITDTVTMERETLHVMDDKRRVAMVETKTVDASPGATGIGVPRWRFQLDNHLASALLELGATGIVISYEEYHPYGTTAFHAFDTGAGVSAKRYRYTGKEKDEETGFYYHGARHYAPWLGRWTATDPAGIKGTATNLYEYCRNNPTTSMDPDGRDPTNDQKQFLAIFAEQGRANPAAVQAQTLVQSFRDSRISGGTAKERLQSILTLTGPPGRASSGDTADPGPHFNEVIGATGTGRGPGTVGDLGFRRELRDSIQYQAPPAGGAEVELNLSSSNQIGHFLTAAHIGLYIGEQKAYDAQQAREAAKFEAANPIKALIGDLLGRTQSRLDQKLLHDATANQYLMAAIGHEMVPDDAHSGSTAKIASVLAPSPEDVQNFLAGRLDLIKINDKPGSGNSYQDLLLTFIGYKFGEKVANNEFSSPAEAARYLELMLTQKDLGAVSKTDPFYKDAQQLQGLLQQFKNVQNQIHPPQNQQQSRP